MKAFVGELRQGQVIAGYRIEGIAGRGGMGVVYRATQLALDRTVALKLIAPELAGDPQFRERFKRESRIAASIRHPNVIAVHDAQEVDGLLLAHLGGEPAIVLGSSFGALIGMHLAAHHPGRVAVLIAHEPPARRRVTAERPAPAAPVARAEPPRPSGGTQRALGVGF